MDHTTCTGIVKDIEEQCLLRKREQYHSQKVKLNTRSLTKTKLVVADMYMPEMLWSLYFMESEGYDVECKGYIKITPVLTF
jgi:hypothetical protein